MVISTASPTRSKVFERSAPYRWDISSGIVDDRDHVAVRCQGGTRGGVRTDVWRRRRVDHDEPAYAVVSGQLLSARSESRRALHRHRILERDAGGGAEPRRACRRERGGGGAADGPHRLRGAARRLHGAGRARSHRTDVVPAPVAVAADYSDPPSFSSAAMPARVQSAAGMSPSATRHGSSIAAPA